MKVLCCGRTWDCSWEVCGFTFQYQTQINPVYSSKMQNTTILPCRYENHMLTSLEKVMTKAVGGNKFTAGFVHKPVHVSLSPWRLICHEECGHSLFLVSDSNLGKVRPHTFLNTSTFVMAHAPVFDQSRLV